MKRAFLFLREWGTVVLLALVTVTAIAAPRVIIRHEAEQTRQIIRELQNEELARVVRTEKAVVALIEGISCILLIEPADRNRDAVDTCIRSALRERGLSR